MWYVKDLVDRAQVAFILWRLRRRGRAVDRRGRAVDVALID
jgi:hypothetical protein